MHLSFLTSHNLLFFRFCKNSKKTTFSVFLSFFLVKSPKSQSLKLNISRTAWPMLMILVSFCRILNGLSDEINLFWRCSSPLIYFMARYLYFALHFHNNNNNNNNYYLNLSDQPTDSTLSNQVLVNHSKWYLVNHLLMWFSFVYDSSLILIIVQ